MKLIIGRNNTKVAQFSIKPRPHEQILWGNFFFDSVCLNIDMKNVYWNK